MKGIYIVTGARGHLGSTLLRLLQNTDAEIRGLVLPQEAVKNHHNIRYYIGDVRDPDSLRPLFENTHGLPVWVIHTAAIVDISEEVSPQLYAVNVEGTRNLLSLCRGYGVQRLLYVSSVHAIPEKDKTSVLTEVSSFSPNDVVGGYAKTKAQATQLVLDAAAQGLNAVVVHPSGILGPYEASGNHLVQLVGDYIHGKLPACVTGGYDFVDVRDVAKGCLLALEKGRSGQCYILSNRHYEIREVLSMVRRLGTGKRLPVLPVWMAKSAIPFMQLHAKRTHQRPLFTRYSLYTLHSNDRFSHDKATAELGYRPRDLMQTLRDTIFWLKHREACSSKT